MTMIQTQGELIMNNVSLIEGQNECAILQVMILDQIYMKYGYENEDIYSIFGGVLNYVTGVDKECMNICQEAYLQRYNMYEKIVMAARAKTGN